MDGRTRLIWNVITSWTSQLLIIFIGFFMPRVIDTELGQVSVGIWDFAWSLVHYVSIAHVGIGSALNRYISIYRAANELEKLKTAVSTVVVIQSVLASIVAIAVVFLAYQLPNFFQDDLAGQETTAQLTVLLLGLSIAVHLLFDTSRGVLTGCHRWDLHNGLVAGFNVASSIAMISAVLLGHGLAVMAAIYLLSTTLESLVRMFIARQVCGDAKYQLTKFSPKFLSEIFKFGFKSFTLAISPVIITQTCSIALASSLGPVALSIFARPGALVRHIQTFVTRFSFMLTPMAAPILKSDGLSALNEFTTNCARYCFAFTLPVVILFCLFGDDLVLVWMGQNYVNHNVILILGLGFLLPLAQSPLVRVLIGVNLHGVAARISLGTTLLALTIGIAIIKNTTESIEAYALLMAGTMTLIDGILIPLYACKKLKLSLSSYLTSAFSRVMIISLVPVIPIILVNKFVPTSLLVILLQVSFYSATVITLYWVSLLDDAAKAKILELIPTKGLFKRAP